MKVEINALLHYKTYLVATFHIWGILVKSGKIGVYPMDVCLPSSQELEVAIGKEGKS